jgi:hypothetical protein
VLLENNEMHGGHTGNFYWRKRAGADPEDIYIFIDKIYI